MTKKDNESKIAEEIYKICKPHFESVLQETLPNSMTTVTTRKRIVWRPNNYRRQLEVKTKDNSTIEKIRSAIGSTKELQKLTISNHSKLIFCKNYRPQINIQYGKNKLTGIWSQKIKSGHKEVYLIEADNVEEITNRIEEKKIEIEKQIDEALFSFAKHFGLKLPLRFPKHERSEDMIKGDEFLDSLPPDMVIHDTVGKKVYKEGWEFKSKKGETHSAVYAKNFIKWRAIDDNAHIIVTEIKEMRKELQIIPFYQEQLKGYAAEIEHHREENRLRMENQKMQLQINKKMLSGINRLNYILTKGGRRFLSPPSTQLEQQQLSLQQFGG